MKTQRHNQRAHARFLRIVGGAALVGTLAACGAPATTSNAPATTSNAPAAGSSSMSPMASMDHSGHGDMTSTATTSTNPPEHGDMTSMATSSAPFDARFIDGMIEHHQGAIAMARQALTQAQHPEIKQLAQNIIDAQQQEIEQLQGWRQQWYPDLAPTGGMGMDMSAMGMSSDANKPFDQRFMEAMIGHHQSAINMAQQAQTEAQHPEVRDLATQIITDQQRELGQMQQWLQQWYGG